ncbi:MAG: arylamine N-acetyltransferase [Nocardioidaceae bacterium]|nr:arylamine N-acetyltransferase [Nocardioidaceae bacterium]
MRPASEPHLAAYLARMGHETPPPPTLETLVELQRTHLARVPYENLGIMMGRAPSVEPDACLAQLARVGRAGYCFHQNAAFERVLHALGFTVGRRHGHVWVTEANRFTGSLNHLALVVSGLPTTGNPGGDWWADVGLGDAFRDPLPVVPGDTEQDGFRYGMSDVSGQGWSFRHDTSGTFTGVEVTTRDVRQHTVEAAHRELSSPSAGHFARFLAVHRRDATGVDSVLGCRLLRVETGRRDETELTSYDEWRAALTDAVGLPLDDIAREALLDLWMRTRRTHREWVAAGRP